MNIFAFTVALISASVSLAQQTRQTNLYNFNKFALNPAYAGFSGCTEVNFSHLNQWVKVEGAPLTSYLSANTRLGKSFGIGGDVMIDKAGMMQQVSAAGSASYGFTIAKEHIIRIGLAAGYFQMRIDPTGAIYFDNNDVIVEGGTQTSSALNTSAGLLYAFKGLELSFASKRLIETRSNVGYPNLDGYGLKRHLFGYASYNILLNSKFTLKPSLLFKGIDAVQQFDINADLNYNDFLYGGFGYRTGVGLIGRVGVNIKKFVFIGYAYEVPMQNIASYGSGSHEIAIGLKFCKKEKEEPVDIVVEPVTDTLRIVETITDTVRIVERVTDTVYIDKPEAEITDVAVNDALLEAAENLEFEFDKAIILKESYGNLESVTNILLVREDLKISLEGHTDNNGTEEYNLLLSKNRVEAVKAFIVANGVAADRIITSYYGESKPIADNATPEGRATNRRVEMKVVD